MRKYERLFAATLAGVAFAIGGCALSGTPQPAAPVENSPSMEASLAELRDYWTSRGVPDMANLALETRESGIYPCTNLDGSVTYTPMRQTLASYCRPSTIVVNRSFMERTTARFNSRGLTPENVELAILAHEVGHEVEKTATTTPGSTALQREQAADCLAGVAVAAIRPEAIPSGEALFNALPGDADHGSSTTRLRLFRYGAQNPDTMCGVEVPSASPSPSVLQPS